MRRLYSTITKIILVLLICSAQNLQAQLREEVNYVRGELIVQPMPNKTIQSIVADFQTFNNKTTGLRVDKLISSHMRAWLLTFDDEQLDEFELLNGLYMHPDVSLVQVNHKVKLRSTTPNDTQFNQQWQYINTGQSGGTAGADLDADSAWSITTGGLTPLGDTIVVAVLDDGIDLGHSDFGDNLWVNHDEIPNNGIDDDGNGYIDDYRGWNISTNDDNIAGGSHGTPVAGIVGAQGDNGNGVSGVNWDVKVMVIKNDFSTTESDVIAAYSYPLTMRKKYNETNGAEGAFVVSTNASWGVNFGQPSSAPVWCAFYDTLGHHGILNCGATANLGIDVDVQGDLPTACSSDYMLSVTNMEHNDNKVAQAGWGATTIDIGAFGQGTWTTDLGGGYAGFGGTSGATPHVAGMVGLLYSAPCTTFANIAKSRPDIAAFLAKKFIMDGATPNTSLNGITVSGGRLNMADALNELINTLCSAGSGSCVPALFLEANNLTDSSATVEWFSVADSVLNFNIQYKTDVSNTWTTITDTLTTITLNNLMPCTNYDVRVQIVCDSNNTSNYTLPISFKTDGCCEPPMNLSAINLTDTTGTIDWEAVLAADEYIVQYKAVTDTVWMVDTTAMDMYDLTGLTFCTSYQVRVQTICDSAVVTTFSDTLTFASTCGNCTAQQYCDSDGSTAFEYIESITLNTINNTSGDDNGYGNYTFMTTDLEQNKTYSFSITPGYVFNADPESVRVRIDFNQDGDLNDPGELVYTANGITAATTANITIPSSAMTGSTRMRVTMRFNQGAGSCAQGFDGEVEDYCVNILPEVISCAPPASPNTVAVDTSSATLNWTTPNYTVTNIIRYRVVGNAMWMSDTTSASSYQLDDLTSCTDYEMQVGGVCVLGDTLWTSVIPFMTTCYTVVCGGAGNLDTVAVNPYDIQLTWSVGDYATSYITRHRIQGGTFWTTDTTSSLGYTLSNLFSCTNYETQIGAICTLGDTLWTNIITVKTDCVVKTQEELQALYSLRVFPNPFDKNFTVRLKIKERAEVGLELMSVNGQVLSTQTNTLNGGEHFLKLNTEDKLASGVYILKVITEEGTYHQKLIKR